MIKKSIIRFICAIFLLASFSAFSQQGIRSIDIAGWQEILSQQKNFSTSQLMEKSSVLIQESIRLHNNGETEYGLNKALASLIIAKHVQNVIQGLEKSPNLDRSTKQLEEYLTNAGLTSSTIEESYSSFIEYTTTTGVDIKHYTQDIQSNNPIPPQRLHWPNTVIQHYDRQGRPNGYSVITARGRR